MEDCDQSKVFVGGISWETTEDVLRDHFMNYGTVVGSVIAKDRLTGSPRGFAFVSFSDASALDKVLLDTHTILGRTVEVKKAVPRSEQNQNQQDQTRGQNRNSTKTNGPTKTPDNIKTKKIFVGGLSANLTEDDFKFYFEKFGRITDVVVMHDNITHRPRGFGFITFDSEDSVDQVMQKNFHELCGKLVEVKRAVPKEVTSGGGTSGGTTAGNSQTNFSGHGYRPRFEVVQSYGPLMGYGGGGGGYYGGGMFSGGFPVGGYGLAPPRVPWGGPTMVGIRGPLAVYPAYLNGGMMGMNGYNGMVIPSQLGGGGELLMVDDNRNVNVDNNSLMGLSGNEQSGGEGNMNMNMN